MDKAQEEEAPVDSGEALVWIKEVYPQSYP